MIEARGTCYQKPKHTSSDDRSDTDLIPNAEASFECAVPPVFEEVTLKSRTPHIPSIWVSPALQSATQKSPPMQNAADSVIQIV
jgi:hypothetical protein